MNFSVLLPLEYFGKIKEKWNQTIPVSNKSKEKCLHVWQLIVLGGSSRGIRLGKNYTASSFPEVHPDLDMGLSFWILVLNYFSRAPRRGSASLVAFHQGSRWKAG